MDRMFNPWRGEYIKSLKDNVNGECIFCKISKESPSKDNLLVLKTKHSLVVINKYPYNSGHIMIVPKHHVNNLVLLGEAEYNDLMYLLKTSINVLKKVYNYDGINIGINIGKDAGAGIDEHVHIHLVPRWRGDANFMVTIADIKLIPEHFFDTYQKLREAFLDALKGYEKFEE